MSVHAVRTPRQPQGGKPASKGALFRFSKSGGRRIWASIEHSIFCTDVQIYFWPWRMTSFRWMAKRSKKVSPLRGFGSPRFEYRGFTPTAKLFYRCAVGSVQPRWGWVSMVERARAAFALLRQPWALLLNAFGVWTPCKCGRYAASVRLVLGTGGLHPRLSYFTAAR